MSAFLSEISLFEWLAVGLALAFLVLAVRQNPWCWACASVSAAIYLFLFAQADLRMQAALQVYYIGMAAYGWYAWRHGDGREPLAVSEWPAHRHLQAIFLVLALTVVNGWILAGKGLLAYADAFVAWASVVTTWMAARKLLESWWYWIVIDLVAAALYWQQGLRLTALLFVIYTIIAVRGYLSWRADLVGDAAAEPATRD